MFMSLPWTLASSNVNWNSTLACPSTTSLLNSRLSYQASPPLSSSDKLPIQKRKGAGILKSSSFSSFLLFFFFSKGTRNIQFIVNRGANTNLAGQPAGVSTVANLFGSKLQLEVDGHTIPVNGGEPIGGFGPSAKHTLATGYGYLAAGALLLVGGGIWAARKTASWLDTRAQAKDNEAK